MTTPLPKLGDPHLFGEEHQLFRRCIDRADLRYLEFGGGGSTRLAVRLGGIVVAVESAADWATALKNDPEISVAILRDKATIIHADIGPVKGLGYPVDQVHAGSWPAYVGLAWAEWGRRRTIPNLVYVDGRFRVACCLSVLVALGPWRGTGEMPDVLIHDFDQTRLYYNPILDYFEIIERVGTLVYMRPKIAESPLALMAAMMAHLGDPR